MTTTVKIALDWTPNSNHTGLYVGVAKGWFKEAGIDCQILAPSDEYSYDETPARRVVHGKADLCCAPTESVISCWTSEEGKSRPVAVATLLQNSVSAIVSLKSGPVQSITDLANHRYASYAGRFEMNIVNEMIAQGYKADPALCNTVPKQTTELLPPKLDCFEWVKRGDAEATWIFMGWEGIQAKRAGIELNTWPIRNPALEKLYGYAFIFKLYDCSI